MCIYIENTRQYSFDFNNFDLKLYTNTPSLFLSLYLSLTLPLLLSQSQSLSVSHYYPISLSRSNGKPLVDN